MQITVLAFARLHELIGFSERVFDLGESSRIEDVWSLLSREVPQIAALRASTRFARNGVLAEASEFLHSGDELALLPPVGGG
jgi:molybdopterin converting factor small subunit